MIPIEGHRNLFRDENSGAIINYDAFEYNQYIKMKNQRKTQKEEIEKIKDDIDQIKLLLTELINETRRNQS
jgi:hypothetical protein